MNKKQIKKEYDAMLQLVEEHFKDTPVNRINCYVCPDGHITKTIDVDRGVTPFMHTCGTCGKPAQSTFYRDTDPPGVVTEEWYRPSLEETLKASQGMQWHILNGGLDCRKVNAHEKKAIKKALRPRGLKAKLDRIFSEYIRLLESDANGYCRCISCGAIHHWTEMDAGHYVNRSHMSLRYAEKNVHAQCRKCNRFDEGNQIGYTRGLIKKYGAGIIDLLEVKKHSVLQITQFDYEILIKHYSEEIKKLKQEKGL